MAGDDISVVRATLDSTNFLWSALAGALGGMLVSTGLTFGWSTHLSTSGSWGFVFWDDHAMLRIVGSIVAAVAGGALAGVRLGSHGVWVGAASSLPAFLLWGGVAVGTRTGVWFLTDWTIEVPPSAELISTVALLTVIPSGVLGGFWGEHIHRKNSNFLRARAGFLGIRHRHLLWLPLWTLLVFIQGAWGVVIAWQAFLFSWSGGIIRIPIIILCGFGLIVLWRAVSGIYTLLAASGAAQSVRDRRIAALKYGIGFPLGAWFLQAAAMILLAWS